MRSGKTLPVARYLKLMKKKTLIVCPPAVIPVWEGYLEHDPHVDLRTKGFHILSSGQLSQKKWDVEEYMAKVGEFEIVVIDEIHQFKAFSERFTRMRKLVKGVPKRIGITATPLESNLQDIFYIWQLLDDGKLFGKSQEIFHDLYCYCTNPRSTHPKFALKKELVDEVMEALSPFITIYRPPEIVPPIDNLVTFGLCHEQLHLLRNFRQRVGTRTILDCFDGQNLDWGPGVMYSKMQQLSSGFVYFEKRYKDKRTNLIMRTPSIYFVKTEKWDILKKIMKRLGKRQYILWYTFEEEAAQILKAAEEMQVKVRLFSSTAVEAFKSGETQGLVCHPRSAGMGIDLSFCNHSIYTNIPASGLDHIQSAYRTVRFSGGDKFNWYLVADHPEYLKRWKRLNEKKDELNEFYAKGNLRPKQTEHTLD